MENYLILSITLVQLYCLVLLTSCQQNESIHQDFRSNYGPEEIDALSKFYPMVQHLLYRDYMHTDEYLIPFLRAQNFNFPSAREMIGNTHDWRRENHIDEILSEDMSGMEKYFPYSSDAVDLDGRPVITWNFGKWNLRRISMAGKMELLKRYTNRILELGATKVREQRETTGKYVMQVQIIIDGNGYSTSTHACLSCMPFYYNFITINDKYYPLSTKRIYLINVPRIFMSLFSLIRPIMSEQTKNSVRIFGHDKNEWMDEFLQYISMDQLHRNFGGSKRV